MTSDLPESSARSSRSGTLIRCLRVLSDHLYKSFTALILYGFFTPLGFLLRLFGRDVLRLRQDPNLASYWIDRRPPGPEPSSMSNLY